MKVRNGEDEASPVTFHSSCRSLAGLGSWELMESLITCDEKGLSTSTVLLLSWGFLHGIRSELQCVQSSSWQPINLTGLHFMHTRERLLPNPQMAHFHLTGESRCTVCYVNYPWFCTLYGFSLVGWKADTGMSAKQGLSVYGLWQEEIK